MRRRRILNGSPKREKPPLVPVDALVDVSAVGTLVEEVWRVAQEGEPPLPTKRRSRRRK